MGQISENERQCFGCAQQKPQQLHCPVTSAADLEVMLPLCSWAVLSQKAGQERWWEESRGSHPCDKHKLNFPKLIWSDQWTMAEFVLFIVLPKTQIRDAHFWNWPWKSRKKQKLFLFSSTPTSHSRSYISSESPVILQLMLTGHRVVIPQQCL